MFWVGKPALELTHWDINTQGDQEGSGDFFC